MNRTLALLAIASLALAACSQPGTTTTLGGPVAQLTGAPAAAAPAATPAAHRFEAKSGILEMTNSIMPSAQQTLYFDDYGAKQATYTVMSAKMMGKTITSNQVNIQADGYKITYDAEKKTGTRMKVPASLGGMAGGPGQMNFKAMSEEMRKSMNVQTLPPKTIDGKEAEGFSVNAMGMQVKAWTWKGLPLYTETLMGSGPKGKPGTPLVVAAKTVKVDLDIPADKFTVPPDVKLTDIELGGGMRAAPAAAKH